MIVPEYDLQLLELPVLASSLHVSSPPVQGSAGAELRLTGDNEGKVITKADVN